MNHLSYDDKMKMCQQKYDNLLPPDTSDMDDYIESVVTEFCNTGAVWIPTVGAFDNYDLSDYIEDLNYQRLSIIDKDKYNQYKELQSYFGRHMIEHRLTMMDKEGD